MEATTEASAAVLHNGFAGACLRASIGPKALQKVECLRRLKAPQPTTQIKRIRSAQGLRMYLNGFRAECLGSNLGRGLGYRVSGHYPDHRKPKNKIIWKLGRYSVVGEVVG